MMTLEAPPVTAEAPVEGRQPKTYCTVTLEKARPGKCDDRPPVAPWRRPECAQVGTVFTYTYKSKTRDEALRAATRWLTVEYPGEDRLDWRLR